ncbi:hypothetical protein [Micromonospora sp. LOL_023]|uniref:hypothetical protein n=1 Tax=Micromonospora sp. LOL_023 TaxID=3345418 RepID=UPI003A8AC3F2
MTLTTGQVPMTVAYDQLPTLAGADLGHPEYRTVTQDQVDLFADATDDHQVNHGLDKVRFPAAAVAARGLDRFLA